ncbi:uncharacterized protein LOC111196684 [Astyanax mexicanus]|uniref:uncharacterized protein LOC111196684 n=1 Tax=Astyanax mexicanus TaxID=7994 RepID=UPI0020CACA84|nr:uncharacterized protein LOC111196684 [Astyanax mexicanus]
MKIFLSTFFTLLTVVNSMVNEEIKVTGIEHNTAVIVCPYTKGYEDYPKYFCKGIYKECRYIIRTDVKERWKYEGRFSLQDDTDKKNIVVTITNLSMNDAGPNGCGIETTGQDPFTLVHLTVIKAPKPPKPQKPHQSTSTTAKTSTQTQPKGAIGGVLLMLAVISAMFYVFRCKPGKNETDHVHSEVDNEDVRLYEEIQPSNPTQDADTISTNQNPRPACITIYSSITNPTPELHSEYTLATNPKPITDSSQSDQSSNDPNYSKIYFINNKTLDSTVSCNDTTYSTVQKVLKD